MAKRGYKLQEFVAHSASVNCLSIGKKARRLLITGGDDYKVNLWTIGKPTSLMSLCGHTSPVESVAFDSAEVLVLAGASSGGIKLWDLEEAKMVRTLTGHRSNCTAVEFHPFGEFFASGSLDTNLRIWDIRKKGCIHTYRGHSQGVSTIKFTPDGRWVVSGGFDHAVKVWDLTAGKLLHDFKFHEGPIRSIDFHPLEFLLATGSADRTVKFWDLESFEMIGSARCEAAGVRSIAFHPDGRALFAGLEDGLKVYSWEPVICHDTVDMGWTTLGDLCIHDGKLLGCSYYRNSVGVWAADISLIEPYGTSLKPKEKGGLDHQLEEVEMDVGPTSRLHFMPPDNEPKEIKNIYIDSSGGKPVSLQRSGSSNAPKVDLTEDSKEICNLGMLKQSPAAGVHTKSNEQAHKKSFIVPNVVPRDISGGNDSAKTGKETINFLRTKPGMLLKPAHIRRASTGICDAEKFSADMGSGTFDSTSNKLDSAEDLNKLGLKDGVKDSCEDKYPIKSVTDQAEKAFSPHKLCEQDSCDESIPCNEEISPVKFVNGVAVVRGRTRSLVERFERKDRSPNKVQTDSSLTTRCEKREIVSANDGRSNPSANMISESQERIHIRFERKDRTLNDKVQTNSSLTTRCEKREIVGANDGRSNPSSDMLSESQERIHIRFERKDRTPNNKVQTNSSLSTRCETREMVSANDGQSNPSANMISESWERIHIREDPKITISMPATSCEADNSHSIMKAEPQISERDLNSANEGEIIEGLMHTHDLTLSNLRSRLTKLQVVRHFWERNDVKGAINALRKLPDQSVQADVISVLVEKTDLLSLELFTCLFPVLIGLLDSKIERHVKLSLDLQLKLVSVFGPTIHSTIRAPPSVGVDLHAEQRREYCNQCFMHLQKIQKILPLLVRRGGLLARSAQELNLVLQQS